MVRLPDVTREQLKPEDQKVFDEIVSSRGGIRGPYGILLHSPGLAARGSRHWHLRAVRL